MAEESDKVENFGKWLTILSSASLGISIVFDYGFYSALGMSFSDVPTQIADHMRSVLIWFPLLFGCVVVVTLLEVTEKAFYPTIFKKDEPSAANSIAKTLYLLFLLVCQVLVLLYGDNFIGLSIVYTIFFYTTFANFFFSLPSLIKYNTPMVRIIFITFPILVIIVYKLGYINAVGHFQSDDQYSNIINLDNETEKLIVLRELEKGVLVSDESRKITFIQWSEIRRIETIGEYVEHVGIMCKNFGRNCSSKNTTKP